MNSICSNFETVFGTNENSMDTGSSEPSSQETDLFSLIKSGNINGSVTTSVTILLFPTNSSYKQIVLVVDGNVVASVVVDVVVGEVFVDVEYVSGFVVVVDKGVVVVNIDIVDVSGYVSVVVKDVVDIVGVVVVLVVEGSFVVVVVVGIVSVVVVDVVKGVVSLVVEDVVEGFVSVVVVVVE